MVKIAYGKARQYFTTCRSQWKKLGKSGLSVLSKANLQTNPHPNLMLYIWNEVVCVCVSFPEAVRAAA